MPNFELVFSTKLAMQGGDGQEIMREGNELRRIISASDAQVARVIAKAMLGEEVFPVIYLGKVLSVAKTNLRPQLNTFSDCYMWGRVLSRLHLMLDSAISGEDTFEGFKYFSPDGSARKMRVGIKFTKAQWGHLMLVLPSLNL